LNCLGFGVTQVEQPPKLTRTAFIRTYPLKSFRAFSKGHCTDYLTKYRLTCLSARWDDINAMYFSKS